MNGKKIAAAAVAAVAVTAGSAVTMATAGAAVSAPPAFSHYQASPVEGYVNALHFPAGSHYRLYNPNGQPRDGSATNFSGNATVYVRAHAEGVQDYSLHVRDGANGKLYEYTAEFNFTHLAPGDGSVSPDRAVGTWTSVGTWQVKSNRIGSWT